MAWMAAVSIGCAAAALAWLRWSYGPLPTAMAIATGVGVAATVMVATALMSLLFLSAGVGHDREAGDRFDPDGG